MQKTYKKTYIKTSFTLGTLKLILHIHIHILHFSLSIKLFIRSSFYFVFFFFFFFLFIQILNAFYFIYGAQINIVDDTQDVVFIVLTLIILLLQMQFSYSASYSMDLNNLVILLPFVCYVLIVLLKYILAFLQTFMSFPNVLLYVQFIDVHCFLTIKYLFFLFSNVLELIFLEIYT